MNKTCVSGEFEDPYLEFEGPYYLHLLDSSDLIVRNNKKEVNNK